MAAGKEDSTIRQNKSSLGGLEQKTVGFLQSRVDVI
jgi:hypothetical protein